MEQGNFFKAVMKVYRWFIILLTSIMFLIVGANVFSRYVLNYSLGWVDELARFIFIWVSFLGAVLAYQDNEHVGLDFVVKNLPFEGLKNFVRFLGDLLVLVVVVFLAYYGWIVANSATNVSPALYIPMRIVYIVVPFSAVLMVIINIQKLSNHLRTMVNKEKEIDNSTGEGV